MPSRNELIEAVIRTRGLTADRIADALLARWPHIAGPERVETVDRVVDERCVLCRYPDPLETGCTACRPDATNPEEGTR